MINWTEIKNEIRTALQDVGGKFVFKRTVFRGSFDEVTGTYADDTVTQWELYGVRGSGDSDLKFNFSVGLGLTVAKQHDLVVIADRAVVPGDRGVIDGVERNVTAVTAEMPFNVPLIYSLELRS